MARFWLCDVGGRNVQRGLPILESPMCGRHVCIGFARGPQVVFRFDDAELPTLDESGARVVAGALRRVPRSGETQFILRGLREGELEDRDAYVLIDMTAHTRGARSRTRSYVRCEIGHPRRVVSVSSSPSGAFPPELVLLRMQPGQLLIIKSKGKRAARFALVYDTFSANGEPEVHLVGARHALSRKNARATHGEQIKQAKKNEEAARIAARERRAAAARAKQSGREIFARECGYTGPVERGPVATADD